MKLKSMKRVIALGLAAIMAVSLIPASPVAAKTKYKTVKEDGKEYIVFGSYEQDGDESNGKESIEWEVLGEDDKGILVVSRYILDNQPYNKEWTDVTWKTCTLRKWLNKKFYNTAFNAKERKVINTVKVKNEDNQYCDAEGGKNTKDKVFCLSVDEILNHYSFNKYDSEVHNGYCQALIVSPTVFARNKGGYLNSIDEVVYTESYADYGYTTDCIGREGGCWWLRSPNYKNEFACYVNINGSAGEYGCCNVSDGNVGVRPAMYLKK